MVRKKHWKWRPGWSGGRQSGLSLIGAIVGLGLLVALGLFMMTLGLHFHRLERESRVGTQLNFVVDLLLARYRLAGTREMTHEQYHITTGGVFPLAAGTEGLPPGWVDTVDVLIWTESLEGGRRIWAAVRSDRSRRAVAAMKYCPEPRP